MTITRKPIREKRNPSIKLPKLRWYDRLGSFVDQCVSLVAPIHGARRIAARKLSRLADAKIENLARSWRGAESERIRGDRWLTSRLSPDAGLEMDLANLQERCEHLFRNNEIAHGAVEGRVANEVGIGLKPQSKVRESSTPRKPRITRKQAKSMRERLEGVYHRWSDAGVDRTRQSNMVEVTRLVCRTFAIKGECFILLADVGSAPGPIPMTLDVIDPERVETPPDHSADPLVRLGIHYSGDGPNRSRGSIKGYWVRNEHQGDDKPTPNRNAYTFYSRVDKNGQPRMLHVFDPIFPAQSRGFPWLAACMNRIMDIGDWNEAEIARKQVEACFGVLIEGGSESQSPHTLAEGAAASTDSEGRRIQDLEPGMVHYLNEGEDVKTVNPTTPGNSYAPFLEQSLRSIAAALNFPYELLSKNFFRTTFSSGRLAMLDGRLGFRMRQSVLIGRFLKHVWKRLVFESLFGGEDFTDEELLAYRQAPYLFDRHKWEGQGWSFIDPEKEVRAGALAVEEDLQTKQDWYAEQGKDVEEQDAQREEERTRTMEANVRIRKAQWDLEEELGLPHLEGIADDDDDLDVRSQKAPAPAVRGEPDPDDVEIEEDADLATSL